MKWPGSMRCSPKPEIESWCPETATEFISRSFGRSLDGGLDVDFINLFLDSSGKKVVISRHSP